MENETTYFDRAWKDLTSDDGWWKAIAAFGIINCIPVIGQIVMFGYLLDWAKEAAWGMNVPLSRQMGNLGKRMKYGFMAVWVVFIWVVPALVIASLLMFVPVVGSLLSLLMNIVVVIIAAIGAVGAFRSLVYEHVMPGLQFGRVFKMARKSASSLAQCSVIILLLIPLAFAALFIMFLPTIPFIGAITTATAASALGSDLFILVFLGMLTIVVGLVVWVVGSMMSALICALYIRSLGYWMAQFEPAKWKTPKDPMPFELEQTKDEV